MKHLREALKTDKKEIKAQGVALPGTSIGRKETPRLPINNNIKRDRGNTLHNKSNPRTIKTKFTHHLFEKKSFYSIKYLAHVKFKGRETYSTSFHIFNESYTFLG